ncbi:ELWxxDGT repeat protein [Myxococcus sp. Y35]|uniref:ELWxxDGT repeat protein n=1 Tax=Pseudomyxococcus flavus TaxID=3115648 RepID=UPI003CF23228
MRLRAKSVPLLLSVVSGIAATGCGIEAPYPVRLEHGEVEAEARRDDSARPEEEPTEDWELCDTNARLVRDIIPGPGDSNPLHLHHGNQTLLFTATDGVWGRELWLSSGVAPGTLPLMDIHSGSPNSDAGPFIQSGTTTYFAAKNSVHGRELWKTDGTPGGTSLVKNIAPGPQDSDPEHLTVFDGILYFTADDRVNGRALWRSDGTEEGTYLLRDFSVVGDQVSSRFELVAGSNALFVQVDVFSPSNDFPSRVQLYRTNGTSFVRLADGPEDNTISHLTPVGDRLFFTWNNDEQETRLYVTSGTSSWARFVYTFTGTPSELTAYKGRLYLSAATDETGDDFELWRSDGTTSGTTRVKDIFPGPVPSQPESLTVVKDRLFFTADDGVHGRELWVSDGTSAGTVLRADIAPGALGSAPSELTAVEAYLFFSAQTDEGGREAWVSDSREDGAFELMGIAPGTMHSEPKGFVRSGWDVYFTATDSTDYGRELRALRLRPAGTCSVAGAR